MNQAEGIVVAVDGRHVVVEVNASVCARCAAGRGCGAGVFSAATGKRRVSANLSAGSAVQAGDVVAISMSRKSVLAAASIVYGYPLAGAAFGAMLGAAGSTGDLAAALCALAGMITGALLARYRLGRHRCLRQFVPSVQPGRGRAPA